MNKRINVELIKSAKKTKVSFPTEIKKNVHFITLFKSEKISGGIGNYLMVLKRELSQQQSLTLVPKVMRLSCYAINSDTP
jgi:hypothetical protein